MTTAPQLRLDWCDVKAATFAVKNWHYSKAMPSGKALRIGVWEDGKFLGCVLFGRGACLNLLKPYGLKVTEGCELTRIALRKHKTPVTKIVSVALRMLKKANPGLRLVVSFADQRQGHLGKIYQAGNWMYSGSIHSTANYFYNGKWTHMRTIGSKFGSIKSEAVKALPKKDGGWRHRYLMPLDEEMRKQILPLKKSPPRAGGETLSRPPSGGSKRCNSDSGAPISA